MNNKIIYGDKIALEIKEKLSKEVELYTAKGYRKPQLVVIQVGNNPASSAYVNGKEKDCISVGYKSVIDRVNESISESEILILIDKYNNDDDVDGLLVQLPLPAHISEDKVINAISDKKDVDGFHPLNVGKMMIQKDTYLPCTPFGCMKILEYMGYDDLSGLNAVVVGRSNIVGKPVAQLLLNKNATVTITHSRTNNIEDICKNADILIAAIGKAKFINSKWIKNGAVVIDVGINRDENNKMCGDVDLDDVIDKVKYITPVPKGVGLMTRAMLLENTMKSYKNKFNL